MIILHKGKVAQLMRISNGSAVLHISKDVTTGDGENRITIPKLDYLRARQAIAIWKIFAKHGLRTNYIDEFPWPSPGFMVWELDKVFPLEFVVREIADGSFALRNNVTKGTKLENLVSEVFLKDDKNHDPEVRFPSGFLGEDEEDSSEQMLLLYKAGTNEPLGKRVNITDIFKVNYTPLAKELAKSCFATSLRAFRILSEVFARGGHSLVDFKLKYGGARIMSGKRIEAYMIDRVTADEFRLYWNGEVGNYYDKQFLRRAIKEAGGCVNDVPQRVLREFVKRYSDVADFLEEQAK